MGPQEQLSIVHYRCVCGSAIGLITADDTRDCLKCGRPIPPAAFHTGDVTIIGEVAFPEADAKSADPLLNQRIKHFKIQTRLGKGGMGAVYRAVDESLQRYVAFKVIHPSRSDEGSNGPQNVERLLREARAQARICHPNVVQVYYVDQQEDLPFLAMELVSGETLEDRLKRRRLTFPEIVDIALQTCRALEAAAEFRIVHGDIKPANLLITANGVVKLSDFGLARPIENLSHARQNVSGTPKYLSPESCRGRPAVYKSDMYSLGVMLFEMTFGRLPYTVPGNNLLKNLEAHQSWPVEYPVLWPRDIPRQWKGILQRLLAKNPDERFRNYAELISELTRLAPVDLPRAGRLARGLAWTTDLSVTCGAIAALTELYSVGQNTLQGQLLSLSETAIATSVLAVVLLIQTILGTTVGKKLFQLRTVDQFGLPLSQTISTARGIAQCLPLWAFLCQRWLTGLGFAQPAELLTILLGTLALGDVVAALIRQDGCSLHDLVFRTHVVLDTNPGAGLRLHQADRSESSRELRWLRSERNRQSVCKRPVSEPAES